MKISVLGAGAWGTCLANFLSLKKYNVSIYAHQKEVIDFINTRNSNPFYLPGIHLDESLKAYSIDSYETSDIIINAVPTQFILDFYQSNKINLDNTILINGSKGISKKDNKLIHQIFHQELNFDLNNYCTITGPSHAEELVNKKLTLLTVASSNHILAKKIQELFISDYLRVYTSDDVAGCELGGALKNVIALASGILSGLDLGDNANAALMTRGLSEMTRLGIALKSSDKTFYGLSGLGDLIVTCSSVHSRNRKAGILIAKGKTIQEIKDEYNFVAEGIDTTYSTYHLAKANNIDMPITEKLYEILYLNRNVIEAIKELMERDLKEEY